MRICGKDTLFNDYGLLKQSDRTEKKHCLCLFCHVEIAPSSQPEQKHRQRAQNEAFYSRKACRLLQLHA